jgi:lipopolysaccharide/colanic/teichoic acid biosynthesis glycosyltransferase
MSGPSLSIRTAGGLTEPDILEAPAEYAMLGPAGVAVPDGYALPKGGVPPYAGQLRLATYEAIKRGLDIVLSGLALLVLSPFWLLIAVIIKLQDGGPIFFIQERVGEGEQHFRFYKFRSMVRDADRLKAQLAALNEHPDQRTFKMRRDPRVTRFGRLLRCSSLDELPQLWNVLKGDMTLVGPRPALPQEVALYTAEDRRRLAVKPGLTCLWQINGRARLPFAEQVRLDVEYIEARSLTLDLEILARTIPAVLSGRGAY